MAASAKNGRRPGRPKADPKKVDAALKLVKADLSPRLAAEQIGIGRSTLYRIVAEQ